jgi:hypothetical protein
MGAARAVTAAFDAALDGVSGALTRVRSVAGTVVSFLGAPFVAAFNAAKAVASGLAGALHAVVAALNAIVGAARAVASAIASIPDHIPGAGLLGKVGGLIPGRADGGPVSAGGLYMVGERGPELFSPGKSGTIIPNAGGVTVNVYGSVWDEQSLTDKIVSTLAGKSLTGGQTGLA